VTVNLGQPVLNQFFFQVAMATIDLGMSVIHRCVNALSLAVVNMISSSTGEYFTPLESLYVAGLAFILVRFILDGKSIHLRLLNRVCLLYCNQQARQLFSSDQDTLLAMFSNLLLAVALAVLIMLMGESGPGGDLRGIFEGMLYLYGDIMDFTFSLGIFKITLCAFMVGLILNAVVEPEDPVYAFCIRMFKIVSANLTSQGLDMLIESTPQLELFECLACVSVLRLIFPSMGSYFVFMAARRVYSLYPGLAPMLFFSVIWLDFLPVTSRGWIGELCCIYLVTSLSQFLFTIPIGGVVVVLVLTHYLDFGLTMDFGK
jgi:hypothetical protein